MMATTNGKETDPNLDLERELPTGEPASDQQAGKDQVSQDNEALEAELERLKSENSELLNRMARMQADFENARRRGLKEQQDFREYALSDTVRSLLPVLDSFDRALTSNAAGDNFREGMELIDRQFHGVLANLGVTEVSAKGQEFDPTVHEAIEMVETDEVPDNHVLEELQRGYKLKDRLLRPAMVRVGRNPGK